MAQVAKIKSMKLANRIRTLLHEKADNPSDLSSVNDDTTFNNYPKAGQNDAKKALDWKKEHGEEVKAMTRTGWARANQLADGEPISFSTVKRISAFNRHRDNSKISPELKDTPWKDRGHVAWLGWGGDSIIDWAMDLVDRVEKAKKNEDLNPLQKMGLKPLSGPRIVVSRADRDRAAQVLRDANKMPDRIAYNVYGFDNVSSMRDALKIMKKENIDILDVFEE